ncbi:LuxR C-terminal-related transcriptional regulator [Streptomyces sp. NPDC048558]|uniref:helix-turn-helix domain-containing protein n=1 Tax=Streptomyces sp. NPDC048558 TaxID=3155759 RepID=UPI00344AB8D1
MRTVAAGGRVIDNELADDFGALGECPLSKRETEILRSPADGLDARETPVLLSLSLGTVRNRLSDVMSRLQARTMVDAVRIAERNGWI